MKKIVSLLVVALVLLPVSFTVDAQSRRAERKAQRKARREMTVSQTAEDDSVNVGYGYTKKKHLTTSVSRVKVDKKDVQGYTNIAEYLQGRVPGLTVIKQGASYKFLIRGMASINSSTDPLLVVNGQVVDNIDYLSPQDIKSVEVLKDASASIYGSRGACGVILITTK